MLWCLNYNILDGCGWTDLAERCCWPEFWLYVQTSHHWKQLSRKNFISFQVNIILIFFFGKIIIFLSSNYTKSKNHTLFSSMNITTTFSNFRNDKLLFWMAEKVEAQQLFYKNTIRLSMYQQNLLIKRNIFFEFIISVKPIYYGK